MPKRSFVLLTVLALLLRNAAFAAGDALFDPQAAVAGYNDSIIPFFTMVTGRSASEFDMIRARLTLECRERPDSTAVYANADGTAEAAFYADPSSGRVNRVTFRTSMEDSSEWKNVPLIIFAFSVFRAGEAGFPFLEWLNDGNDDGPFTGARFSAAKETTDLESRITITAR